MTCSWLVHYLLKIFLRFFFMFMTYSLFRNFLQNLLMTCSGLFPTFFTTCSWLVHHLFTTWSLLVHELLELLLVKDLFSICSLPYSWLVLDLFTTYSWLVHNFLPFFHNLFMYLQDLFTTFFLYNFFTSCSWLV